MASSYQGEVQVGFLENFLLRKSGDAPGVMPRGGSGVTIPGGVGEPCGCGTEGHGLVVMMRIVGVGLDDLSDLFQL